jgi:guanyl-specific ribonuclease Sa
MLARALESTVQFPRLPLAKTVIRTGIKMQNSGVYVLCGSSKPVNGVKKDFYRTENHYRGFARINAD